MAAGWFLLPLPLLLLAALPVAAAIGARPGPDRLHPLAELCQLPKVVGRCRASILRWWFNGSAGACQSFTFGGCEGNSNNFPTELECRESCSSRGALKKPDHRSNQPASDSTYAESCTTPFITGPCRASFPRWYHNATTGTCQQFIYGGCRGNKNNYLNEEECLNRCLVKAAHPGEDFFPTKGLVFGALLVLLAVIFIVYVTYVTIKTCRRKPEIPGLGMGWSPGDDKEYLMSNAYTL